LSVRVSALAPGELILVEQLLPSPDPEIHARRLASQEVGGATYYIAWLGDRPVGHTLVRWGGSGNPLLSTHPSGPITVPYIEGLHVHPAYRSRGIGAQIIAAAEAEASRLGHDDIGLAVSIENVRALALYTRLGYRDLGLGQFPSLWSYVDHEGKRHVEVETCVYLSKPLRTTQPTTDGRRPTSDGCTSEEFA
jgi:GNAT superfamily N-acetyltransferase